MHLPGNHTPNIPIQVPYLSGRVLQVMTIMAEKQKLLASFNYFLIVVNNLTYTLVVINRHSRHRLRDGQFRIIYYSRIVKPNPESESFLAISTINMKAFITSLQQQKHNQETSFLKCNQIMSASVHHEKTIKSIRSMFVCAS